MKKVFSDIVVGILTGTVGGLCVLFAQFFAEVHNQKYNMPLIAVVASVCVVILLVIVMPFLRTASERNK